MIRVDVDDRIDTMGSVMTKDIWDMTIDWFLESGPAIKGSVSRAVIE